MLNLCSDCAIVVLKLGKVAMDLSILTWHGDHRDQEGGVSTARPIHCTPSGLTRTTTPNRGGSSAQFLLVGTSVRAVPLIETKDKSLRFKKELFLDLQLIEVVYFYVCYALLTPINTPLSITRLYS